MAFSYHISADENILVTGIPRSGTSLFTKLISLQDKTVCFSEPEWLKGIRWRDQSPTEFVAALQQATSKIYSDISQKKAVKITVQKGTNSLPDNYFHRMAKDVMNMKETVEARFQFSEGFSICTKSNTLFTACLPELVQSQSFKVIAVVRNPIAVLMSWRSLDIPVSRGQVKIAEMYSQEMRQICQIDDLLQRQVRIMDWFFKKYIDLKKQITVVKYEDVISDQVRCLSKALDRNDFNTMELVSNNQNPEYNLAEYNSIKEAVAEHGKYYQRFYSLN